MIQAVNYSQLSDFFKDSKVTTFKRRDMIMRPDENTNDIIYIQEGFVRAYRISEKGEELTFVILKKGDFFPFTFGSGAIHNSYYLEAITQVEILRTSKDRFLEFIRENPDIYYELTNNILARVDGLLTRMEHLVFGTAYTKIATTLLMCAKRFGEQNGSEVIVRVPLTHQDIATLVGITRETTSLEMKKLEKKGILRRQRKLIVIKNIHLLEKEALVEENEPQVFYNSL